MDLRKLSLINEQTSPLQRIMWVYNMDEPARRSFQNNICSFHIGNGYFLSVAHNLRTQTGFFQSLTDEIYRTDLLPKLDGAQKVFLEQSYFLDAYTKKWHLNTHDPGHLEHIAKILKQKRFDTRWETLAAKGICKPYLLFEFRDNVFYDDIELTRAFPPSRQFLDGSTRKHTFFVEVELVKAFYSEDIALYKVVNTPKPVIDRIPVVAINYEFSDFSGQSLYCLQSAPNRPAGRLLNNATVEGILDHFEIFNDDIGGNYNMEGYRYLVHGYFRFGSSGAPYLIYDSGKDAFEATAIQSEASGIQFAIKGDREGNIQFTNAIATPLFTIKEELERIRQSPQFVQSGGFTL